MQSMHKRLSGKQHVASLIEIWDQATANQSVSPRDIWSLDSAPKWVIDMAKEWPLEYRAQLYSVASDQVLKLYDGNALLTNRILRDLKKYTLYLQTEQFKRFLDAYITSHS